MFKVEEISRTYRFDNPDDDGPPLGAAFELVLAARQQEGYRLDSWRFDRVFLSPSTLDETIIAVFVRVQHAPGVPREKPA